VPQVADFMQLPGSEQTTRSPVIVLRILISSTVIDCGCNLNLRELSNREFTIVFQGGLTPRLRSISVIDILSTMLPPFLQF
jgi:hypothetical protein